jgi:hypothetical protein
MTAEASTDTARELDRAHGDVAAASRDLAVRVSDLRRLSRRARAGGSLYAYADLGEGVRRYEVAAARARAAQQRLRALRRSATSFDPSLLPPRRTGTVNSAEWSAATSESHALAAGADRAPYGAAFATGALP